MKRLKSSTGRKKRKHFAADFETTTDPNDCRVWWWGLAPNEHNAPVTWGTDIVEFMQELDSLGDSIVSFHNLKFDGTFILDWLFRQGFTHTTGTLGYKQFSSLISDMGNRFYSIKIMWESGVKTELRDSMKKLPFSVAYIASAFKLPVTKGEIDYHAPRPVGYSPTPQEIEYGVNDVKIIASAMKTQLDNGMEKLTVGSDSLAEYKSIIGAKSFDKMFPVLSLDIDADIRSAYRGGFTYVSPRFKGKMLGCGKVYDVNSLYPSVMYDRLLPYGIPEWEDGLPTVSDRFPLFIVSITFTAKIKKKMIPLIQVKSSSFFLDTEYQEEIKDPVTLSFTSVDLEMIQKHYDLDIISYNGGWKFRGMKGAFCRYIDKWMQVKMTETGALRELAKLMLNSLYGKFATNPSVTSKIPVLENNVVRFKRGEEETRDPVYTAMGAFITAYARAVTIGAAQDNFDTFAYADTDSLHLVTTTPPPLNIDPHALGAWKHEYDFTEAKFMRAKSYMERKADGALATHIAGLPRNVTQNMGFDDMRIGTRLTGKLMPRNVPGGVVLEEREFTFKG